MAARDPRFWCADDLCLWLKKFGIKGCIDEAIPGGCNVDSATDGDRDLSFSREKAWRDVMGLKWPCVYLEKTLMFGLLISS